MKRPYLLLLAAVLAGCDGTDPVRVANVEIVQNQLPLEERTILVGETLQLTVSVEDASQNKLTGRPVSWQSSAPSVASVDTTGLVTGVSPGEAVITATSEGVSDDVLVVVQAPLSADLTCDEGDPRLNLAVGEVHTTSALNSPLLCVDGGASGSEYTVVPFNAAEGAQTLQVEIAGGGVIGVTGPPNPARFSQLAAGAGLSTPRLQEDHEFHRRLREMERRQLGSLARGGGTALRPSRSMFGTASYAVSSVGDTLRFNVNADVACESPDRRLARVMAVSQRAVIVADTGNPSGGFTQQDYEHFAVTFDTLVYPAITGHFGVPSDIDQNGGRAVILFTRAVNELTEEGSGSFVGGFFFSRDLFPKVANDSMGACPASNEAEMFYMLVPDPNGEVNNNVRTKDFVAERTVGVLAHEFQHLINASRRLFVVKAGGSKWIEEAWLNEGLSHIAEELLFYATTPHESGENIDVEDLRASNPVFDKFRRYAWSNFARYVNYLQTPRHQSLMGLDARDDDLATRGATWAFLRYAADREGGSEAALWKSLVDSELTGLANLNAALPGEALDWMRDWTVSVYTDDAVPTLITYQQPSWNFRNILTGLRNAEGQPLYSTFPLRVDQLGEGDANRESMTLQGGGAAFLRFGVAAGTTAGVRATSGGLPAPSRLKISIVRTK